MKARLFAALCLPLVLLTACNIFDPIDSPNTDAQILSAARAAMDRGDFEEARQELAKLSQSDETVASEEAFNELNAAGATMGNFMKAFGGGGGGPALTTLANDLVNGAGEAKRLAIYDAYTKVSSISSSNLRGLVRLATGVALAAEILAEQAPMAGVSTLLEQEDIVTDPTACNSVSCPGGGCTPPGTGLGLGAAVDISPTPAPRSSLEGTDATLQMFNAAIGAINDAITEVSASGKFSTGTGSFASDLLTIPGAADCYRQRMLDAGIGL